MTNPSREMENFRMLGWMIVFALMAIFGAVLTLAEDPSAGFISAKLVTLVFGVLFLACLLTSVVRRRA
jgi:uncharacterized membrane protein YtjA (UPF0391 family)